MTAIAVDNALWVTMAVVPLAGLLLLTAVHNPMMASLTQAQMLPALADFHPTHKRLGLHSFCGSSFCGSQRSRRAHRCWFHMCKVFAIDAKPGVGCSQLVCPVVCDGCPTRVVLGCRRVLQLDEPVLYQNRVARACELGVRFGWRWPWKPCCGLVKLGKPARVV